MLNNYSIYSVQSGEEVDTRKEFGTGIPSEEKKWNELFDIISDEDPDSFVSQQKIKTKKD